MAKRSYIISIGADTSILDKKVSEANGKLSALGKNKVKVDIDFDYEDIEKVRDAIQELADYNPKLRSQINYDLQASLLNKKLEENTKNTKLQELLTNEKAGKGDLSKYVSSLLTDVYSGLMKGIPEIDLADKFKEALDLKASFEKYTGRYLSDDVDALFENLEEDFTDLESYTPRDTIFKGLPEEIQRNKELIRGLKLSLEELQEQGAIATDKPIDLSGLQNASADAGNLADQVGKVGTAISDAKNEVKDFNDEMYNASKVAKESVDNMLQVWNDFDREALKTKSAKELKERAAVITQEGNIIGGFSYGDDDSVSKTRHIQRAKSLGLTPMIGVHSHGGDDIPSMSVVNKSQLVVDNKLVDKFSGDLLAFWGEYEKGITKQVITGLSGVDVFDSENFFKKYGNILEDSGVAENLAKEYKALKKEIQDNETEYLKEFVDKYTTSDKSDVFESGIKTYLEDFVGKSINLENVDIDKIVSDIVGNIGKPKESLNSLFENALRKNITDISEESLDDFLVESFDPSDLFDLWGLNGIKQKGLQHFQMTKKLPQVFERGAKIDNFEDYYKTYSRSEFYAQNPLNLDTSGMAKVVNIIDDYVAQLERLYQIEQTLNNMKVDSADGKSYEEIGKHIEKMNAQYEQTIAEIEKLREIDDGSQSIKEQIGLLENLAVAYQNAIKASIPNDVSPGNWISKYTNIPRSEFFGEDRLYRDQKIKQNADQFKESVEQGILDIYKLPHYNEVFSNISDDVINTSALSEIPEIMERITSAGKEATQTMDEFNNTVSGKGVGDTPNEDVDALKEHSEYLQERVEMLEHQRDAAQDSAQDALDEAYESKQQKEDAERQLRDAEERIQVLEQENAELKQRRDESVDYQPQIEAMQAEHDSMRVDTEETERDTEATERNTEAHKENQNVKDSSTIAGSQEADTNATRENTDEIERNTEAHKENQQAKEESTSTGTQDKQTESIRENTSETERNTEAQKENKNVKESTSESDTTTSSTERMRENTEETERNTQAQRENSEERERAAGSFGQATTESTQKSAADINEESEAFNKLGASAILAAANKDKFTEANISLASQINGSSVPAIEKEAAALKELSSATGDAASAKKEYSKAEATKSKAKSTSKTKDTTSKESSEDENAKAKADAEKQAADLRERINRLSSGYGSYYKNVQAEATGRGGKAVENLMSSYEAEVASVTAEVEKLNSAWGEQSEKVKDVKSALDEYKNRSAATTATDVQEIAKRQLDKIDRAEAVRKQQGSDFMPEYAAELEKVRQNAVEIAEAAKNIDFSKAFDRSQIKGFITTLEDGDKALKKINDQQNLVATKGSLEKLRGKIAQDMSKGGLSGNLAQQYIDLKGAVDAAISSLDEAGDAAEKVSKVDLRGLIEQHQRLNASAKETGQLTAGFGSKFSEAINNQSAQFLATYFSFQDMIRYARQITSTVTETNSALTELKKVSDASNERIQQSFRTSAETAQELGATITNVINSTADWARLNYRSVIW